MAVLYGTLYKFYQYLNKVTKNLLNRPNNATLYNFFFKYLYKYLFIRQIKKFKFIK